MATTLPLHPSAAHPAESEVVHSSHTLLTRLPQLEAENDYFCGVPWRK